MSTACVWYGSIVESSNNRPTQLHNCVYTRYASNHVDSGSEREEIRAAGCQRHLRMSIRETSWRRHSQGTKVGEPYDAINHVEQRFKGLDRSTQALARFQHKDISRITPVQWCLSHFESNKNKKVHLHVKGWKDWWKMRSFAQDNKKDYVKNDRIFMCNNIITRFV